MTNRTILLVEDNIDSLISVSELLRRHGMTVLTADTVESGIEVGSNSEFDILLCDIGLPDGYGWDVLNALRVNKNFPAIALTAHVSKEEILHQQALGFDTTIAKPFRLETLVGLMRSLLAES